MPPKLKRLIGNTAIVVFVTVYILIAMGVGNVIIATKSTAVQLTFFILAGLGWVPVAGLIIKWMYRQPKPREGGSAEH